jgi:hypothetical protein
VHEQRAAQRDPGVRTRIAHELKPGPIDTRERLAAASLVGDDHTVGLGILEQHAEHPRVVLLVSRAGPAGHIGGHEQRQLPVVLVEEHQPQLAADGVAEQQLRTLEHLLVGGERRVSHVVESWDRHAAIVR